MYRSPVAAPAPITEILVMTGGETVIKVPLGRNKALSCKVVEAEIAVAPKRIMQSALANKTTVLTLVGNPVALTAVPEIPKDDTPTGLIVSFGMATPSAVANGYLSRISAIKPP
jgi:hypothetical protein